jgi:hypothetical protein
MNDRVLAKRLLGDKPVAWMRRQDGILVVIGPDGRKHLFSIQQQEEAQKGGQHEPGPDQRQ